MKLNELIKLDNLKKASLFGRDCFIHDDHRWVLPVLFNAQEKGKLDKPCTAIILDRHHDSLAPRCENKINQLRDNGLTIEALIELCQHDLGGQDDDWIIAGMELGLIADAIVFGASYDYLTHKDDRILVKTVKHLVRLSFEDHFNNEHLIYLVDNVYNELMSKGCLCDYSQSDYFSELWNIINWRFIPQQGFTFADTKKKMLLDFDLDYFGFSCGDYIFPWPEKVFNNEIYSESQDWPIQWSMKKFIVEFIRQAGILTIAREPQFCGSEEEADQILKILNERIFDGKMIIGDSEY